MEDSIKKKLRNLKTYLVDEHDRQLVEIVSHVKHGAVQS